MKLECAEAISSQNATEAEIQTAFADDHGRGEFIILSDAGHVFIQASGEGDGPYTLEYREGGDDCHFQCTRGVRKAEVEAAFLRYLRRDAAWKADFQWNHLEKKPWWRLW